MSVFVVFWHLKIAGISTIFSKQNFSQHTFGISDFINFHILLEAVPVFLLISLFLYARKATPGKYLWKRIKYLAVLTIWWSTAYTIFKYGYTGLSRFFPEQGKDLHIIILTAGGTIYYFFVSLMLCTLTVHWMKKLGPRTVWILAGVSFSVLFLLPLFTINSNLDRWSAFWNPLNFLPYPFAAVLLARYEHKVEKYRFVIIAGLVLLTTILGWYEWNKYVHAVFFPGQGYAIPAYTRTSVFLGAAAILVWSHGITHPPGKIIRFMSGNSLGLYCLHPFVSRILQKWIFTDIRPGTLTNLCFILLVIVLSYLVILFLRRYVLKQELV